MRQGILAAALLAASAGFASADYVVIVANVGGERELNTLAGAGIPGMGGPAGMRPGMAGMGMRGMMPPGQGMPRGQAQGMRPGMGNQGGMRPGMTGRNNEPIGPTTGMRAGMMGMMGLDPTDADDIPDYVIAVVEVKPKNSKAMAKLLDTQGLVTVRLPDRLGKTCQLLKNPPFGEMFVITEDNKPVPPVASRFKEKFERALKEKASASDLVSLAQWTLEHGLVDKFAEVMNKVVEADKGHSAAVAYVKVKADLDRKTGDDTSVAALRRQVLSGYKVTETPHYLLVHNLANETAIEVKTHTEHLENAFRGFYYWFVLRGIALPVPQNRQVAVLTSKSDDFEQLHKILTAGPLVIDGFFARRESLAVMHSQRQDDPYKALNTFWENWKGKGYQRFELLENKSMGLPKNGVPLNVRQAAAAIQVTGDPTALINIAEAQMLSLMLKALEQEAELATISHGASRQLLFASGLLPRNVAVPEWILFGMGSFFETPLQSPWPTIGAPSPYYLPRWRELKAKDSSQGGLEKAAVDTLRKVITDGYFRTLPADGKPDSDEHLVYESALRKTRTASWSLAYFLTQKHLDGLRRYFAELSKMPRDIELDDVVLLGCFARAFGCVDGNNKVDQGKLKALANDWYAYWQTVHFESEPIMKDIREKIAEKVKEAEEKAQKQGEENNGQQGPGAFPGMNRGNLPPGMNPQQRGPQQRGPQQGGPQQGGRVPPK